MIQPATATSRVCVNGLQADQIEHARDDPSGAIETHDRLLALLPSGTWWMVGWSRVLNAVFVLRLPLGARQLPRLGLVRPRMAQLVQQADGSVRDGSGASAMSSDVGVGIDVGIDATVRHLEEFLHAVITTEEEAMACRDDMVRYGAYVALPVVPKLTPSWHSLNLSPSPPLSLPPSLSLNLYLLNLNQGGHVDGHDRGSFQNQ